MKKNQKGFTMIETLVAATLIISTLIFLFVQFNNLKRSYDDNSKFDSIQSIHEVKQLLNFYKLHQEYLCDGYTTKPCKNEKNTDIINLYNKLNIKESFVIYDLKSQNLEFDDISSDCTYTCQRFIKKSRTDQNTGRLIATFKDNTYASIIIK